MTLCRLMMVSPEIGQMERLALARERSVLAGEAAPIPKEGVRFVRRDDESDDILSVHGSTGVIRVQGVLRKQRSWWGRATTYDVIQDAAARAERDPSIERVWLHGTSPGGGTNGGFDCCDALTSLAAAKPLWGFVEEAGLSMAYLLLSQCRRIYCNATADLGCLGVVTILVDSSGFAADLGFKDVPVSSAALKAAWSGDDVPQEVIDDAQRLVDQSAAPFMARIRDGRGWTEEQTAELHDGRWHMAQDAVQLGLADGVLPIAGFHALVADGGDPESWSSGGSATKKEAKMPHKPPEEEGTEEEVLAAIRARDRESQATARGLRVDAAGAELTRVVTAELTALGLSPAQMRAGDGLVSALTAVLAADVATGQRRDLAGLQQTRAALSDPNVQVADLCAGSPVAAYATLLAAFQAAPSFTARPGGPDDGEIAGDDDAESQAVAPTDGLSAGQQSALSKLSIDAARSAELKKRFEEAA